ncbi:hypothetical protein BS47DRAFT_750372 [Hydnum rufescens UP504]|uniref:E3 ubiquitin protein ligase n=1 Tax=Hydnum rufescens UP504 TaxID=1448309 RepID=A0A9P6BA26_9AGAM|nr:hypothetical protein BS47DRAFT_750372 [Hydnum rufescens UP504]
MDTLHRKRPSSPTGSGPSQVKKRAITSSNGSPASIVAADTPIESEREPQANNLELFRKEAIFRRMRQHARERDRAESRIAELEHRKLILEAAMGAVENCWNQILDQLQTIVKTNSLPIPGPFNIKDLLSLVEIYPSDSNTPSEQFRNALLTDGQKTLDVIASFVAMTPPATPEYEELRARCQNATAEATSLRTELHLVYASFIEARSELEQYKELLSAVELRADRARSESIIALEMSTRNIDDEKSKAGEKISSKKEEGGESPLATQVNGKHTADIAMDERMWKSQAEKREREITQIVSEKLALRKRLDELQAQFSSRSEDLVRDHPAYVSLVAQMSLLRERTQRIEEDRDAMQSEVKRAYLEANQRVEEITAVMEAQTSEHEEAIKKKNKEIVRTKDQRESALKDLAVHKASDASKSKGWDSITARAHSLEDRVASLLLEVKRLKAQLAAKAGSEDLLSFLLETSGESLTFVQDLQNKVGVSRAKISALEATIASLDQSHPDVARHLRTEAQAREECDHLRKRVERYESIFGTNVSADSDELARLLRQKDDELQSLRLLQKQEQASSNDLFDELQRMSTAWEILDKQSKAKVDETATWETKYNRVSVERKLNRSTFPLCGRRRLSRPSAKLPCGILRNKVSLLQS